MRNTDTRDIAHTKRPCEWKRERRAANRNKWSALQRQRAVALTASSSKRDTTPY